MSRGCKPAGARLKREIKKIDADLKLERQHLRALALQDREPDIVPSRVFGEGVGHRVRTGEEREAPAAVTPATDTWVDAIDEGLERKG